MLKIYFFVLFLTKIIKTDSNCDEYCENCLENICYQCKNGFNLKNNLCRADCEFGQYKLND